MGRTRETMTREACARCPRWAAIATGTLIGAWSPQAGASDVIVSPNQTQQRIDGFGASSAWNDPAMSDGDSDLAFSVDAGAGLSLLRVRIAPDGTCGETQTALQAQKRGATVWATPWSPPSAWKMGTDQDGNAGYLLPQYYDSWAASLVGFVRSMQDAGVNIAGVSAQNEPNWNTAGKPVMTADGGTAWAPGYEGCLYDAGTLADFIGNHLGPAFQDAGLIGAGDAGLPVGLIAPETQGWDRFPNFESQIVSSSSAMSVLGTIATHSYGGTPGPYPEIAANGKRFWQTEVSQQGAHTPDTGMTVALSMAGQMHTALTYANVNAWHYWWLYPGTTDNSGLWNLILQGSGPPAREPSKRLWVMGNYSRFVRPGFYRVASTGGAGGVMASAYTDRATTLVIVAVNATTAPDGGAVGVSQTFRFDGVTTGSWSSWVTSSSSDLQPGDAIPDGASITYMLQPDSVTTLVGTIKGAGPPVVADAGSDASAADGGPESAPYVAGCGLACSTVARRPGDGSPWYALLAEALVVGLAGARTRSRRRRSRDA